MRSSHARLPPGVRRERRDCTLLQAVAACLDVAVLELRTLWRQATRRRARLERGGRDEGQRAL